MKNNRSTFGLAFIGGIFATLGLLFSISLLVNYQGHVREPRPLLVLELAQWPAPVQSPVQKEPIPEPLKKEIKEIKPLPKPLPKPAPVAKKIVTEKAVTPTPPEPVEEIVNEIKPTLTKDALATTPESIENPLPTPVPIFKLTQTPQFLHREVPRYPPAMQAQGITGIVKLEALIDKKGQVRKVRILKSAGDKFDEAARRAIFASSFYPAKIDDEAVAVLLRLPVKFSLL